MTSLTPQPPAGDDLVARLREEAEFLSGLSINHGRADYGVSANLANEAADFIEALTSQQHTEPVAANLAMLAQNIGDVDDAPQWIRVAQDGHGHHGGFWTCAAATEASPKFIRADIFAALLSSYDALEAALSAQDREE